jgi:hypothetical protein
MCEQAFPEVPLLSMLQRSEDGRNQPTITKCTASNNLLLQVVAQVA